MGHVGYINKFSKLAFS
uniref:Uncharacterized protein n=1 Tax=Anguilla anguilla TaxID=7936 RepID=A0A0E9XRA5_ANGAN